MRRSCFVHTAALHLDLPFEGVGAVTPPVASALCAASVDAWDELVRLCAARRAAFLVIAGGLFGDEIEVRAQARLRRGLLHLGEQGVQVFVALGREEAAVREWFAAHEWPGWLTVFPVERPVAVRVVQNGAHVATVVGQSHAADWSLEAFLAALPSRATAPLIAVAPCDATALGWQQTPHPGGPPGLDYWALGGAAGTSRQGFHPWIVEPGPLQARAAQARHLGPRGAMVADLHDDKVVAVELVELDPVRWLRLEWKRERGDLLEQLVAELLKLRAAHAGRGLLVDIVLHGGAAAELAPAAGPFLLAELRRAVQGWEPFVWCNALRAAPSPERLRDDLWNRDELAAAVVQSGRAVLGNPLQRSLFLAQRCAPLLRRWTEEMQVDETERLVDDATRLAVAALLREGPP